MKALDYNQISNIVLHKALPVYVIDGETREIVSTNKVLDDIMGSSLTGENCYKAFFGDKRLSRISPASRAPGKDYQWDYADRAKNKLYEIQN